MSRNTIGSFSKGFFSIVANIAIIEKDDPSEKDPIAILAIIAIVAIVAWSICGPQGPKWRRVFIGRVFFNSCNILL